MPLIQAPISTDDDSLRNLAPTVWYWKRKFVVKETRKDKDGHDFFVFYVFKKWDQRKGGTDLLFLSPSIKSVKELMDIFDEDIPMEIVEECTP